MREKLKLYFNQKIISKLKNKDQDESMKTKMFAILKISAKRRAIDFYSAQVEGDSDSFGAFL